MTLHTTHGILRDVQSPPAFLPIFRSPGQARLLALLFLDGGRRWRSLTELARAVELAPSSVQREVERLERAGIVTTERIGNIRRVRASDTSPFYPELRGLLIKAFGPVPVLAARLLALDGVERAFIFGSWARDHLRPDEMTEPPGDIDVVVIGTPDPDRVYAACEAAESELGIEISPLIVDAAQWSDAAAPGGPVFLRAVRQGELVPVAAEPDR